ncbi:hypothetical protein LCGC14_3167580 [marine sediment metagenome]|uniref:Uncharacterized protein n=1 Tax=marine sediment metagenome TaxID=412755 RepID=A0A0F8VI81_9ZZZZ
MAQKIVTDDVKIKFQFDKNKFYTVMQILCQKVPELDINKACLLLYFIDREHLRSRGRPVQPLGVHIN